MNMNQITNNLSEGTETSSFDMIKSVIPVERGEDDSTSEESEEEQEGQEEQEEETQDPAPITPKAPALKPAKVEEQEEQEEEEDEEEEGEDSELYSSLSTKFGDVELESNEFETEEEAVIAYAEALGKRERTAGKEDGIKELFGTFPELQQLANHLNQGHSITSFMKQVQKPAFIELDLENAKEEEKLDVIRRAQKQKGMDDDDIEDLIETIRDKGTVDDRATKSQTFLKSEYEKEIKTIQDKEKAEKEAIQKENEKANTIINKVFETGDVSVAKLNTDQIKTLKDFVEGRDADGSSLRDKAWKSLPIEKLLFLDYMIATDFKDIKSFAPTNNKAESNKAKGVKIKKSTSNRVVVSSNSKSDSPLDVKKLFGQNNNI